MLVNAAAALVAAGRVDTIHEGIPQAAFSVDSGAARSKLDALVDCLTRISLPLSPIELDRRYCAMFHNR